MNLRRRSRTKSPYLAVNRHLLKDPRSTVGGADKQPASAGPI
jgi:hypothetical protein